MLYAKNGSLYRPLLTSRDGQTNGELKNCRTINYHARPGGNEGKRKGKMTKKELRIIRDAIGLAQSAIEALACENYPYTDFDAKYLSDMHYDLNDMWLKLSEKIKEADQ